MTRTILAWLSVGMIVACDGSGRAASAPPGRAQDTSAPLAASTPAPTPLAAPPVASSANHVALPPAASAEPPRYPEAAIDRARGESSKNACMELVYKRGCAEVRTGHVRVRLTLGSQGNVENVEILANEIGRDPEVVAACLKKKLPLWKFEPPDGAVPVVELELTFSDKC